jgi:hypothetical protein
MERAGITAAASFFPMVMVHALGKLEKVVAASS